MFEKCRWIVQSKSYSLCYTNYPTDYVLGVTITVRCYLSVVYQTQLCQSLLACNWNGELGYTYWNSGACFAQNGCFQLEEPKDIQPKTRWNLEDLAVNQIDYQARQNLKDLALNWIDYQVLCRQVCIYDDNKLSLEKEIFLK